MMLQNQYQLFIGANNQTKLVEVDKVVERVSKDFLGFTITRTLGYWEGVAEDSIVVTIFSNDNETLKVQDMAVELCATLNQQSILVSVNGSGELIYGA